MKLTDFDYRTLKILHDKTCASGLRPSSVGHLLWQQCDHATRKSNPSAQGLALFAGGFLGPLQRHGFVDAYKGYSITSKGRAALRDRPLPGAA